MAREMKDSGIAWIGEIPKDWEVCKFKHIHNGTNVGESIDKAFWSENKDNKVFYTAGLNPIYTSYLDFPKSKYTNNNDILLARNGTPYVYLPENDAVYTDHIIRVSIKKQYNRSYIKYAISQSISFEIVDSVSIATWSASLWNEQTFPLPTPKEQQRIAAYLDKKCGEIDSLISLQEKMIEELKAYKQSVITEAVTKGLNPNVKMKDSGVDWIGEIPEHWDVTKVKLIARTNSGSTPKNVSNSPDSSIIWIRTTDMDDNIVSDSSAHLTEFEYHSASCPMLNPGTCLVAMYGGGGTIGKSGYMNVRATINQALCSMEVLGCYDSKYLFCVLRAVRHYWMKYAVGTRKDPNINQEIVKNLPIPITTIEEQQQISSYLDSKCSEIDSLIAIKQKKIDELKDYKKSLIYEYVTGKKEVV